MAYEHVSNRGQTFLPWAMLKNYNGTSAGFDWSEYNGRPWWGVSTETNTNNLWPAFLGYRGATTPSQDSGSNPDGVLALEFAKQQLGEPYSLVNVNGPDSWGCSGLTAMSYNLGVPDGYKKYGLLSYSESQINSSRIVARRISGRPGDGSQPPIPSSSLKIGDLLYYSNTGLAPSGRHIAIYAGNDQVIEAGSPVKYTSLSSPWHRMFFDRAGTPIAKYASGGFVAGRGGPRSDMIPAMLSNGEYVVKAGAVNKYGRGMLDQINAGNFGMSSMQDPKFSVPVMPSNVSGVSNNYGGSKSNVKIIINGASGKSATAIANKVASMINSSNNRRKHSRSL
jgi:cell wall-associated NlpC family hydrolase